MKQKYPDHFKNQKGAIAVVVAILMIVIVGFAALAIDIGYTMVNKNELQNIADGAALAASRELGEIYTAITNTTDQQNYVMADAAPLVAAARQISDNSRVAGDPISIAAADVRVGRWVGGHFMPTFSKPDAVNVTVRRDSTANGNGPIATFLAGVLNISSINVSATATAALLNILTMPEGAIRFPIGLSKTEFPDSTCTPRPIRIYSTADHKDPTNTKFDPDAACAAWNALTYDDHGAEIIESILNGDTISQQMTAGLSELNFTGGTGGNKLFTAMTNLFNNMRNNPDKTLDYDDNSQTWTTVIPVYDVLSGNPCNPSGFQPVVGFAAITITGVDPQPAMVINANINCDVVINGVSGGVDFGALGSIPNLVQ